MPEVFLVDGVHTPQGKYGGALAALVVREAVARSGVPGEAVDEVILGAANQAGEDNRNVARMAALLAGLPEQVPGYTVVAALDGIGRTDSDAFALRSHRRDGSLDKPAARV